MAQLTYEKAQPVRLRELGLDERWLQARIEEDPSILGLGELEVISRESSQPTGGRIDFLMYDPDEAGVRYEIEVMLGRVDESHIIRTIEYWDVERQRYPKLQHTAVLVAEDLTTRFLNVIALLNRAIPMIAIQLSAFRFGDRVVLHFAKLLDIQVESLAEEEPDSTEVVDRHYWEKKSSPESIGAADKLLGLVPMGPPTVFNKHHITVSTSGRRFLWIWPRKSSHVIATAFVGDDKRDEWVARLNTAGLDARPMKHDKVKLYRLVQRDIAENGELLRDLLTAAEQESRTS